VSQAAVSATAVDAAVTAIQSGQLVVLPTDTVYGLCTGPYREEPARRMYRLKGREETTPTALICSDLEMLFECVPELRGKAGRLARALLPGPYTLVFGNPGRRYRWLTGSFPDTIGVRVPDLPEPARSVLQRAGAVAATSANLTGGPDPRRVEDIPAEIREACEVVLDGGELPGITSTVLDLSGPEPKVAREGAVPAAEALARIEQALSSS
jgi:L-threonylcarbamoyladenylate synthase